MPQAPSPDTTPGRPLILATPAQHAFVPALTGLRGVAAAAVMALHLWIFSGRPELNLLGYPVHAFAACGFIGVDLFFVLSAFLLSQPFLAAAAGQRAWPRLPAYFKRRVLRVVPAYWVQIALLFPIGWFVTGAPPFDLRTALLYMFFLQHLVVHVGSINPVYWSLPVEWWFYFCLPAMAWLFARARWFWLLALFLVLGVGFRAWLWGAHIQQHWLEYGSIMLLRARIDQFFMGVLAAWAHMHVERGSRARTVAAAVGALVLVALLPSLVARGDLFVRADFPYLLVHYTVIGAAMALVVFGAAGTQRWSQVVLGNRAIVWLGTISYSVYLWHSPVFDWIGDLGAWTAFGKPGAAAISVATTLLVAWVSYRFIERRFSAADAAPYASTPRR
jgi:peptidoglycan/LPS O-acetylase OafA/YrhL